MLDVLSQDFIRTGPGQGSLAPAGHLRSCATRGDASRWCHSWGPRWRASSRGSLVVEQIFAVPGLGSYFVQAAILRDYTLAMGVVLLYTVLLYTMNWLVDLSYAVLDPRVELN